MFFSNARNLVGRPNKDHKMRPFESAFYLLQIWKKIPCKAVIIGINMLIDVGLEKYWITKCLLTTCGVMMNMPVSSMGDHGLISGQFVPNIFVKL